MSDGPLVSVLIPAHNAEPWLGTTLDSVYRQTHRHLEVIVVDDGSTDDTARVASGFAGRGLRLIRQSPSGACAARNAALAASTGSFIQFLDADDLISPQKIRVQLQRVGASTDLIASGEWGRFHTAPDAAVFTPESVWRDLDAVEWLLRSLSSGQPMMQCGIFLIPRSVLARSGGWDERLSLIDDFEFFVRVILASRGVRFCPSARLYYRSGHLGTLAALRTPAAWRSALLSLELGGAMLLERTQQSARARRACAAVLEDWVAMSFLKAPEFAAAFEGHLERLGDANIRLRGGPALRLLDRGLGWRRALRVQEWCYAHGYERFLRARRERRAGAIEGSP
jgi:GT2 family glycosyltransferase